MLLITILQNVFLVSVKIFFHAKRHYFSPVLLKFIRETSAQADVLEHYVTDVLADVTDILRHYHYLHTGPVNLAPFLLNVQAGRQLEVLLGRDLHLATLSVIWCHFRDI
jgi:hypothetical protein